METEKEKNHWASAYQHAEKYASLKYEHFKYELIEKAALVGSSVTTSMVNTITLVISFMLVIMAAAFAIGEYTGHIYLGFAFAAAFFLVGFFILLMSKRAIRRKILNFYLRKAFEREEE